MKLKVSSVNPSSVFDATKFLNDPEENWYSDAGTTQHIIFEFDEKLEFSSIKLQFQGGFGAYQMVIKTPSSEQTLFTEDVNDLQHFNFSTVTSKKVKLIFSDLADLYGRLIVYKIEFK